MGVMFENEKELRDVCSPIPPNTIPPVPSRGHPRDKMEGGFLCFSSTYEAAPSDMQTYQICTVGSSGQQGVIMATVASPSGLQGSMYIGEEVTRKREIRLLKNREAARECRRKKKEYVKCLENRVTVLEKQNKTLIEELKGLKDMYCNKAE
ncbi:cAMP-responsive element modulator-like isoform X1 [Petromyzon marinus]|uniref:cAMP-responsive element modulator-like isoform X1 n=3 Tax=Petromyzon marinus TaxID=7757 RepID=A0AAJ7WLZ3_PETMA|nr:cAMP-responsive element modulator-like isoform X1 [Petromyzon marinus]